MVMRFLFAAFLGLVACSSEAPTSSPAVPVAVADPPAGTTRRMTAHYQDVVEIKDAVIAGDLPRVRAPARRLREVPGPVPAAWRPFMIKEGELATLTLSARNLRTAAKHAAALADNCGECHEALGGGPQLDPAAAPPAALPHQPEQHMLRHQWAADRMWDALIVRSEDAWAAGADLLIDAPLSPAGLTENVELPEDVFELGQQVHELGARARVTAAWPARAQLYGEFLATCATCHLAGC
jgi:cytochrome c553